MERQPGEEQMVAWRAFLAAHARLSEVLEHELERERGMPLGWYDVLVQLDEAGENRLRMADLARAVLLSRAGLTRLVDRMGAAGLVERVPCEDDRRGTYVVMTHEGRAALSGAAPVHLRGIEEHFGQYVGSDDAKVLASVFRCITDSLAR
ncbi:MAG: MarR family transcriptional regulator [Dehalococcoidia bacterium]|nr:MarR family transcriptional regulator [Dehalococcoidia bacterium]